jgi:hypothetical protein
VWNFSQHASCGDTFIYHRCELLRDALGKIFVLNRTPEAVEGWNELLEAICYFAKAGGVTKA